MRRLIGCLLGLLLMLPATVDAGTAPSVAHDGPSTEGTPLLDGLTRVAVLLVSHAVQVQEAVAHQDVRPGTPRDVSRGAPHAVAPRGVWQWPLAGQPEVVKAFDPPEERWLPGHRGIDLAGFTYAPVRAVADGTVTYSGSIAGIGVVSITHADGIRSTYQPVTERIDEGELVSTGDTIGYLGAVGSHCLLRTCLHLGAVRGEDDYLDPLLLLQRWELTLLPHAG